MTNRVRCLLVVSAIAISLQTQVTVGQGVRGPAQEPPVPPEIQVPSGNTAFLLGHAIGTQNYICQTSGLLGFSWRFLGPQATLFSVTPANGNGNYRQIATHFLSPNPIEAGTPRPTWQDSSDTSAAWGRARASSTNPSFVQPTAIPWLLLEVVGTQLGTVGPSVFAETTFIQRLNTTGGLQPSTGCNESTHVGNVAFVPYTADYLFFRASRGN